MIGFDRYTVKARIQPALYVVLPFGILLFMWMPGDSLPAGALLGIISTGGGATLISQIGRDQGRKKQPALWNSWGGAPTTRHLRFRDTPNKITLQHRRAKLERLIGYTLPSEQEESEDLAGADQKYEAGVSFLLESTRDISKFPLVFAENVNYGFRRNLWGMKPYGLLVALLAMICSWGYFVLYAGLPTGESWTVSVLRNPDPVFITRMIGLVSNTLIAAGWLFIVRPQWVKIVAEAYAQRLLGTLDALDAIPAGENPKA